MQFRYSLILLFSLLTISLFPSCVKEKEMKPIRYIGSYNRDFRDLNDLHLEAAKEIGIEPVADREAAEKCKGQLKEIKSCDEYTIRELTHSIPFLVPEAAKLMKKIGENFRDSLDNLNAPCYKLVVTSVTRTQDDIARLRKRNGNSSENSAHKYGTTIDISWKTFEKNSRSSKELTPDQLKMVLASVLRDLKRADYCYIKHEKKQACFHITARRI